jgi:hypothetical protein
MLSSMWKRSGVPPLSLPSSSIEIVPPAAGLAGSLKCRRQSRLAPSKLTVVTK